jgi:signal transduction histidine kinase
MIRPHTIAKDRLADASIRSRIWQLAILACTTLIVLACFFGWSLIRDQESSARVLHNRMTIRALFEYDLILLNLERSQRGYLLTQQADYLAPYNKALADRDFRLRQVNGLISDPTERGKIGRLSEILHDKVEELALTVRLTKAGNLRGALAVVREGRGIRDTLEFERLAQEISNSESRTLTQQQHAADVENRDMQIGMGAGGILALLLIVGAASRTVYRIDTPLRELMAVMAAVAQGHQDIRVNVRSHDEIGRVAKAFNDMLDELRAIGLARDGPVLDLARSNRQLQAEITERTDAQARLFRSVAELRRSNEELDNFAYSASHDLKAPLRGIRNLTEWIVDDVKDKASPDTIENLALLHTRVERLDMLLNSLLQYSRVGRGGGAAENIDIAMLVGEIVLYSPPPPGFTVSFRGDAPTIRTNKAPLEQVLRNLITNGLKHNDAKTGAVVVSARDLGDTIEIRVEDDGPGIPTAFHARVFQMFQTLKSRDEVEGSGMGLAIVKKSVEGQGGTIAVESAPPLRGTAFVFTWKNDRLALAA